jgi:hypothetical protein
MPSGSIYTYIGNADASNNTGAIQTSQGVVVLGSYGYFTPAEHADAVGMGLLLAAGQVGPAAPSPVTSNVSYAILGSDGTVGGPGGSPVSGSVGGPLTLSQLPQSVQIVAGLSGRAIISTVTSGQAAWQADVQAQAAAGLAAGTAYSWSAINPTTGTMLDFGSGVAA